MNGFEPALFDDHAQAIAKRQYMQPGDGDVFGMFRRVATWVASPEKSEQDKQYWSEQFYRLMASKRFCPGGRVLAGAGTQHGNVLNCFVQGATEHDPSSFDGVMEVATKLALVTKVGGGNGVNLDPYVSRKHAGPRGTVRGFAYIAANHADVEDFIKGMMRPPINPDGDKEPITVRNWTRVVYGLLKPELAALARRNGVMTVREKPSDALVVPDDMRGIIEAAKSALSLAVKGQEPHVDFSSLRPEGAPIRGSGGTSSGPVSFLVEIFDNFLEWANLGAEKAGPVATLRYVYAPVLRVVRQGGTRRGAGMATIAIDHPDLLDFLTAKDLDREASEGDISTFNISILVTEAFWQTLQADGLWAVEPSEVPGKYYPYPVQGPYTGVLPDLPERTQDGARPIPVYGGKVPAKWLWHEIAWHAWATGEPGLIFVDRINELSALKNLGERYVIKSTNPCGEIPLTVGEPCDLGAINLAAYVEKGEFNFAEFRKDVRTAIRFLDNVLDVNVFALEDNRVASQSLRRLGLGVMGLADMLIKMGLPYSSEAGRRVVAEVMNAMREEAIAESERLGQERGVFPVYEQNRAAFEALGIRPRRNVAVLTVAPTGTTSMLMGVSSGIEPMFSPFMWRRIGGQYKALLHPLFVEMMEQFPATGPFEKDGAWNWDAIIEAIQANHGSVKGLEGIPAPIASVFEGAHDVPPLDHVRMQGVVQTAFDAEGYAANSLSKTINLPNQATVEDVEAAYTEAYRTGCKGITVYRDGSREFQVLSVSKEEKKEEKTGAKSQETVAVQPALLEVPPSPERTARPIFERTGRLVGYTDMVKLTAADGTRRSFLVTVNMQGEHPVEVILTSGKAGDEANADSEALGRIISKALQYGVPVAELVKTLRGINGGLYGSYQGRFVTSKADLIAVALETSGKVQIAEAERKAAQMPLDDQMVPQAMQRAMTAPIQNIQPKTGLGKCPECGDTSLVREEGCVKCYSCGYSKCG
ncbi:adenosylcobalamin-dependent ribonucleoside-diphosphate reductase [Meiothermus taiwanensis]|jgi:ribonucleoside-diphosphate reductase alpha chain|uniref:Vitamin B12-dependent ribonucleotide reductase n=2 Tax=Meiothermus taiwanensis TaxID=172827 RepID=A0A399DQC7_9DEIN|nr:adenosylcobalamin-dependent ribonucleoside-diphosphate reductase [Meiothermus taiwanensis]AWR86138.1 ribonucleoside-diphosphate reductase, adenosylcobalamin-dependent [Meiothermus taiwanensis WR-220]KIQ53854.1 ribonucleoside-diphosphate reductase [Meiothermus taiwanensis]KZK15102.1 ribonucleoside-diphosphate reductase [Meiothermus taiwanensis]RIH74266.1 Vitamin B12-dependent ribonucleoside-diphosphate reductase [Meiothermus taiwanensis]